MDKHTETKLDSKEIFSGKIFDVTVDSVELENGNTATREIVHHNGGAAVLALNAQGEVALVRQFRYAAGAELIEIPAGKIEKGEAPRATAERELGEEIGYAAAKLEDFGYIIPTCAYCTERIYLFLATGLQATQQHLDADEFLDVFWLPLDTAVQMVYTGEITDGKTVAALLRAALLHRDGQL